MLRPAVFALVGALTAMLAAAVPTPGLPEFPPVYFNGAYQASDYTGGMVFDEKTGDSYPGMIFTGDINIPNIGTFSSNGMDAILLYKITRHGDVVWATKLQPSGTGAYSYVGGQGALDGKRNVWIYGDFRGTLTIDGLAPLIGVVTPSGARTGFVAKFDAETGRAISAFTTYCTNPTSAANGPRTYSLAPAGTGEMYVSIVWDGECTLNVPGIAPITEAGGGQLIVKINEACTEGLWYSYIGGDVDGGQLAVDFATGDILGAVSTFQMPSLTIGGLVVNAPADVASMRFKIVAFRMAAAGVGVWGQMSGTNNNANVWPESIAWDPVNGMLLIAGSFNGLEFIAGDYSLPGTSSMWSSTPMVYAVNGASGTVVWAKVFAGQELYTGGGDLIVALQYALSTGDELFGVAFGFLTSGYGWGGNIGVYKGNPYIYGSFNAVSPDALVIPPYQLQSTPTPPVWMSNVLIGAVGVLDTDTLQVTTLSVKTKRTKPSKHRALGDADHGDTMRDRASMRPLHERALVMGGNFKSPSPRHNKTEVDTWAVKGVANFTRDPTTPATIPVNGIAVELSNSASDILDTVAFAASECKLVQKNRRILCKHKGGPSRLTLTQRKAKGTSSFLPVWQLSGHFRKQDIVGDIAATPLTVALYIDIAFVDSVPNCQVAKSGLAVNCKDAAAKLK